MRKPVIKCLYFSLSDSVEQFRVGCPTDMSKYARCQVINHFTAGGEKKKDFCRVKDVGAGEANSLLGADLLQATPLQHRSDRHLVDLLVRQRPSQSRRPGTAAPRQTSREERFSHDLNEKTNKPSSSRKAAPAAGADENSRFS